MKGWKIHLYILCAAVALRLVYLSQYRILPFLDEPISDSLVFDQSARTLKWWKDPAGEPFHLSPGYHLWLSAVYQAITPSPMVAVGLQFLMGVAIILLIGGIAGELFGPREAIIAEVGALLFGPFLFYETKLLAATPSLVGLLGGLLLLIRGRRKSHAGLCAAGGVACGLATAFRPNLLPLIPAAAIWIFFAAAKERGLRRTAMAALVAIGGIACLLPFPFMNYRATGELILLTDSAGTTFYFGNNPYSRGRHGRPPGFRAAAEFQYADAKRLAEEDQGRSLSPNEISDHWLKKGLRWIRENPGDYVRLELRKLLLLVNYREGEGTFNFDFERSLLWWLRIPFLSFGFFLSLSAAGVVLFFSAKRRDGSAAESFPDVILLILVAAIASLMCLVFFTRARYRLPMVPVLIILSSTAVTWLIDTVRENRPLKNVISVLARRGWAALLVALVVVPITLAPTGEPRITPTAWNNLGGSLYKRGDISEAEFCFHQALRVDPGFPYAHVNLAVLALGRRPPALEEAKHHLEVARRSGLPLDRSLLEYIERLEQQD